MRTPEETARLANGVEFVLPDGRQDHVMATMRAGLLVADPFIATTMTALACVAADLAEARARIAELEAEVAALRASHGADGAPRDRVAEVLAAVCGEERP